MVKGYLRYRINRVRKMYSIPHELQQETFETLLENLKATEYGRAYSASKIKSIIDFKKALPIVNYEDLYPYIETMMRGTSNVLWPGKINMFAKSSGTTNDKSKYIPISEENLFENHVAASWDAVSILYQNRPDTKIFDGKNLIMGGSLTSNKDNLIIGDVSAILLDKMPMVGKPFYTPDSEIALLPDWEQKIDLIAKHCLNEDVVMFAGVPTWTIVLFNKMLDMTGKSNMREIWPNVKTYLHGGVGFDPYVEQFRKFIPYDDMEYYEVYNASEGYFAVQDRLKEKGMLLLLDNSVYYEFIPLEYSDEDNPQTLSLDEVEEGKDYVIVISTSSGLWRYKPGDIIRFVTIKPYRIMVSGRTKQFINVFGEEVMVHNTDQAIKMTIEKCPAILSNYTVGPIFMENEAKGGHHWLIEFEELPQNLDEFSSTLDGCLRSINSDYDAKRYKDIALQPLKLTVLPKGSFYNWLKSKNRLGGQTKVPRLANTREYIDQLLSFI